MDYMRVYDIIYALAAKDGREATLFGGCAPRARAAFSCCLTGEAFPELWFELPLSGEPWFDFHALVSHGDVTGTKARFAGHSGIYADALEWFARQKPKKVRQLALSYDTSANNVESPAVQLLVNSSDETIPLGFLDAAGRPDAKASYSRFVRNMPQAWYACYVGVFPGRQTSDDLAWVRVECIIEDEFQKVYAKDSAVLREHLARVGLGIIDDSVISGIQKLACSSFPLELQFNVDPNGAALPLISASVRFQPVDWTDYAHLDEIGRLASWMQSRGIADKRCALLAETIFSMSIAHEEESVSISCFPAFVKLRWREGHAPDAKAYLMARAQQANEPAD